MIFWRFRTPKHYVVQDLSRHTRRQIGEAEARRMLAHGELVTSGTQADSYYARLNLAAGEVILWANPRWTRP